MAHSYARERTFGFIGCEIVLFSLSAVSTYLSTITNWPWFWAISGGALILFATIRILEVRPQLVEYLAFEDTAANMARSAMSFGIERLYNMQLVDDQNQRNADTVAQIRSADALWLCANSGASYLDPAVYRHWPVVQERLREDVPFRIILLDPASDEKALRDLLNVGEDATDSKVNLPNLIRLYNQYPSLEIRFVSQGMHATVFATPSKLFYDPYHVAIVGQRIENRSFCMKIGHSTPREGMGYYDLFRAHFSSLWRVSVDFEEWVEKYGARFQGLPQLTARRQIAAR